MTRFRNSRIVTLAVHEYRSAVRSRVLALLILSMVLITAGSIVIAAYDFKAELAGYKAYLNQVKATGVAVTAAPELFPLQLLRGTIEYVQIIGAVIAIGLGFWSVMTALSGLARSFTERTLVKACRTLVRAGYADPYILEPARRLPPDTRVARLLADRVRTHPDSSLRELATWLSRDLREPTPRGGLSWSPEGVRRVLAQAKSLNLIDA